MSSKGGVEREEGRKVGRKERGEGEQETRKRDAQEKGKGGWLSSMSWVRLKVGQGYRKEEKGVERRRRKGDVWLVQWGLMDEG